MFARQCTLCNASIFQIHSLFPSVCSIRQCDLTIQQFRGGFSRLSHTNIRILERSTNLSSVCIVYRRSTKEPKSFRKLSKSCNITMPTANCRRCIPHTQIMSGISVKNHFWCVLRLRKWSNYGRSLICSDMLGFGCSKQTTVQIAQANKQILWLWPVIGAIQCIYTVYNIKSVFKNQRLISQRVEFGFFFWV